AGRQVRPAEDDVQPFVHGISGSVRKTTARTLPSADRSVEHVHGSEREVISTRRMGLRELADLREDSAESCKDLARIDLPFARGREERAARETALAAAWRNGASVRTALWEAAQEALSELELGEPADAVLALHERGWSAPGRSQPPERAQPLAPPSSLAADESPSLVRAAPPSAPEQSSVTQACEKFLS